MKKFPIKSILLIMVFTKPTRQRRNLPGLTHGAYTYVIDIFLFFHNNGVWPSSFIGEKWLYLLDQFS